MYVSPAVEIQEITTGEVMIEIGSGDTSPEESDANKSFFDEDEGLNLTKTQNLWDD